VRVIVFGGTWFVGRAICSVLGANTQHLLLDASKARQQLGWRTGDVEDALRRTVRWHLDNPPENQGTDFALDDEALGRDASHV